MSKSPPPRLPSPPPFPEIQIGPKSPSLGALSDTMDDTMDQALFEALARRRIHPGTRAAEMAAGPPLVPLEELDSAFALQEHLKALHYHHTKPADADHTIPITRETAKLIATPPEDVDPSLWLYELCRFLINKCNDLIVGFLFDEPACSSNTCPEMRASEWQFLCAVHEAPKSCCAIDYCCHTLDWATNIVTSQKNFPGRLSNDAGNDFGENREAGLRHLVNIFRRLHRIFAHAWFQHRGVFWQVESQTGLYVLFKTVCDTHQTLPAENFKLPPEAEGLEQPPEAKHIVPTILRSEKSSNASPPPDAVTPDMYMSLGRTNTKRHIRSSPSTGSAVTTVLETDEADEDHSTNERLDGIFFAQESLLPVMGEAEQELESEAISEPKLVPETQSELESETTSETDQIPEPELKLEDAEEYSSESNQETAEKTEDDAPLPVVFDPPENPTKDEVEEADTEEKPATNGSKATKGDEEQDAYEDIDEAAELELESFEELPIPQIQKEAPMPSLQREETLKPAKSENELAAEEVGPDLKTTPESEEDISEKAAIDDVGDDEEKPVSEVSS